MDEAIETMIKNFHACVLHQLLNKNAPLKLAELPCGPWIKGRFRYRRSDGQKMHSNLYQLLFILSQSACCGVLKRDVSVKQKFMYWRSHNTMCAWFTSVGRPEKRVEPMFGFCCNLITW